MLAVSMAMLILSNTAAQAETKKNNEKETNYAANTDSSLWSMSSVFELYKLSGWSLLDVQRIWANKEWPNGDPLTRHNAFTDLVWFKDQWYCVFRVGENHGVTGSRGGLRCIRSRDGKSWTSVFFYQSQEKSVDVRDSKLVVTEGQIMILGHESYRFKPAKSMFKEFGNRRSMTWLSSDGEHWSGPNFSKGGENTWIWSGGWHKGIVYGMAHADKDAKDANGAFYRMRDGKEWELLASDVFPKMADGRHKGNEASFFFDADDNVWMYLRDAAVVKGKYCNIGFSKPPYQKWDWSRQTSVNLGGPKMIRMSDGRIVVAGRMRGRHGASGYGDSHTALYELDLEDNTFHKIANLPSQGDTGYPGIVEKDGVLWISYYSSHEDPNPEGRRAHNQRNCIYLARIKIGGTRFHYVDKYLSVPKPSSSLK